MSRPLARRALVVLSLLAALCLPQNALAAPPPQPRPVDTTAGGMTTNPLAEGPWVVAGFDDVLWKKYRSAGGSTRSLLARTATQPRMVWFGHWFGTGEVRGRISKYLAEARDQHPRGIAQMALFRLWPREESARHSALSGRERDEYRAWYREVARGIGDSRVSIVLEPDMGIAAYQSPDASARLALVRYAAELLGQLPNASVYIDAASADWLSTSEKVRMLDAAGIEYVRGYALGATHYPRLSEEVEASADISRALAAAGLPGKHAVIDTADNGVGFTWLQYRGRGDFDNAHPCRSSGDSVCNTLGVPPTSDVANERWPLTSEQRAIAREYVDGYAWFGRPWLYRQAWPFVMDRALQVARSTPFQ